MVEGSTPGVPDTVRVGAPSVTVTLSTVPELEVPSAAVHVTERPIRPSAPDCASWAAILSLAALRLVSCSTDEIADICWTMALLSMGDIGSWCCIWATNSFRKSSLPSVAFGLPSACVPVVDSVVELVAGMVDMELLGSGEDVDEQPAGQLERRGERGIGVRGGFRGTGVGRGRGGGLGAARVLAAGERAGRGLTAVLARGRHLERDEVHVARLERAAQVVAGLGQH